MVARCVYEQLSGTDVDDPCNDHLLELHLNNLKVTRSTPNLIFGDNIVCVIIKQINLLYIHLSHKTIINIVMYRMQYLFSYNNIIICLILIISDNDKFTENLL